MAALGAPGAPSGPLALAVVVGHPQSTAFALGVDTLLVLAALAYGAGVRRRRRTGAGRWSGWRVSAFVAGLLLVYVAVGSGLAAYSARPSVVVAQHVLLMMAAPPLLVLGCPGPAWAGLAPRAHEPAPGVGAAPGRQTAAAGRSRWARLQGVATWAVFYGSMAAFFLTRLFPDSLHDPALLDGSEVWFGVVGLGYSAFVVGGLATPGRPSFWSRIVALLTGAPVETAVGLALLLWPHPLAAGVTLATTHTAGLVLWAGSMLTSGLSLAYVLGLWVIDDSRRESELDVLLDAAVVSVSLGDGRGSGRPLPR